jgi:hypothetical protein
MSGHWDHAGSQPGISAAAPQGWPSSPQEGQLLAAGGAQYLAPSSGNDAAARDSQVVHDFHAALGRSPDMAVAVAAIKVRNQPDAPVEAVFF